MPMPSIAHLGRLVKAKYPDEYDDLSDQEVGERVKALYPDDYDDFYDPEVEYIPPPSEYDLQLIQNVGMHGRGGGIPFFDRWEAESEKYQAEASKSRTEQAEQIARVRDINRGLWRSGYEDQNYIKDNQRTNERKDLDHHTDRYLTRQAIENTLDLPAFKQYRNLQITTEFEAKRLLIAVICTLMELKEKYKNERMMRRVEGIEQRRLEDTQSRNRIREEKVRSKLRQTEIEIEYAAKARYDWEQAAIYTYRQEKEYELKHRQMLDLLNMAISYRGMSEERKKRELVKIRDEANYQIYELENSDLDPRLKERLIEDREEFLNDLKGIHDERPRRLETHDRGNIRGNGQNADRGKRPWNAGQGSPKQLPARSGRRKPKW